jgi:hypothetical protein
MRNMAQSMKIVSRVLPQVVTAAQIGTYNFTSLRNYQGAGVLIKCGALNGAAPTISVTQAKNVEGNGMKAISFDAYYTNVPGSSPQEEEDRWDESTGAAGSVTVVASTVFFIPIRPGMLDVSNDFDCIRPELTAPGTNLALSVDVILWGGPAGISGSTLHIPSAAVNRMPT